MILEWERQRLESLFLRSLIKIAAAKKIAIRRSSEHKRFLKVKSIQDLCPEIVSLQAMYLLSEVPFSFDIKVGIATYRSSLNYGKLEILREKEDHGKVYECYRYEDDKAKEVVLIREEWVKEIEIL